MGVDERREFTNKLCQLSCHCQTRIRVNESGEFTYEFSQPSCPGQKTMRVDEDR